MSSPFSSNETGPVAHTDSKRIHPRAKAHGVSPQVVVWGDALRLAFLACYVFSATVSQVAAGALIVYLISG